MKTMLVACLLLIPAQLFAQGTYTAEVVVHDIFWWQGEWRAEMDAQLLQGEDTLEDYGEYFYKWWRQNDGVGDYTYMEGGYGHRHFENDNEANVLHRVYVEIIVYGDTVTSEPVVIVKYGDPQPLHIEAKKWSGDFLSSNFQGGWWSGFL